MYAKEHGIIPVIMVSKTNPARSNNWVGIVIFPKPPKIPANILLSLLI